MTTTTPRLRRAALVALCLAAGAAHADTGLLRNGSFETGDFSSWQTRLGDATTFVDYGPAGRSAGSATDGRFLAWFGSTQASGGSFISQTFSTTPGARYVLGFDLADDNAGGPPGNAFSVSLDGTVLFTATGLLDQAYTRRTYAFAAPGTSSTLTFGGYNDSGYVQLDAVTVTVAAVPEPANVALLLAGAALLVPVARRRSRRG